MPLVYLHGPNAGKTLNVGGVNFVKGVASIGKLSNRLVASYGVKDFPPVVDVEGGEKVVVRDIAAVVEAPQVSEEVIAAVEDETLEDVDGADILRQVIEEKKEAIEKDATKILRYKDFSNIGKFRKYVKEITGIFPKSHKEGDSLLDKFEGIE